MVIYATKYGSTREYASLIARKLGTELLSASEAPFEVVSGADFIVLGSPIYAYSVLPEMEEFLEKNRDILVEKPVAAFVVCGDTMWNPRVGEGGDKNLRKLTDLMGSEPFAVAVLGGRMRMEELDDVDGPRIMAFYERIGREPLGFDRMDPAAASSFVENIRRQVESGKKS